MEKISSELYSGGYINYMRIAKSSDFYFKAECRAQMQVVCHTLLMCEVLRTMPVRDMDLGSTTALL